jgi:rhodanese-related sulfurtransferase
MFSSARTIPRQAAILIAAAIVVGLFRQTLPYGIRWNGRWPTSATSAEDAYKMMARPGDPAFVSLQDVIEIVREKTATLLDARSADEYKKGHLPSARSLPFYEMDEYRAKALNGLATSAPLVIYCEGVGCELSLFLSRELQALGYTNIRIFYGGYPEWSDAGLPVEAG